MGNKITCPKCNGAKEFICNVCDGTGIVEEYTKTCYGCDGSGRDDPHNIYNGRDSEGYSSAYYDPSGAPKCSSCDGRGYYDSTECERCNGYGKYRCEQCHGIGKIEQ